MERSMSFSAPHRAGFTMIELLAVVAIMSILMALVVPSITSVAESSNLTQAGQTLADQVNLARQIASAKNLPVEIRLIRRGDVSSGYNAIQLWTAQPVGKIVHLPKGMLISEEKTKLSVALAHAYQGSMPDATAAPYVSFQIRPSGVVTPTLEMKDLFLTVLSVWNAGATEFPKNYLTVQINPFTGTTSIYRP